MVLQYKSELVIDWNSSTSQTDNTPVLWTALVLRSDECHIYETLFNIEYLSLNFDFRLFDEAT